MQQQTKNHKKPKKLKNPKKKNTSLSSKCYPTLFLTLWCNWDRRRNRTCSRFTT